MKDVGGVAEKRSLGQTAGRKARWREGRNNALTDDEGHFYSPPPPMSGDINSCWSCSQTDKVPPRWLTGFKCLYFFQ